jgi:tRNA 2-thiouridine synthesizing protein A
MTPTAQSLDARGLNCPLPILRTRKAMTGLTSGDLLEVTATDPGSLKDMEAYCRQTGNELLSSSQDAGAYQFLIRKS